MKSKTVSKKAVVKSKDGGEKKEVKAKVVEKKKMDMDPLKKKWNEECSFVEEEDGKCLIIFESPELNKKNLVRDLGLVAVLMFKKIMHTNVYTRKSKWVSGGDVWVNETVYEYDKKHIKKIKEIEIEYFFGELKVDEKALSDMKSNLDSLMPEGWRESLTKEKVGSGKNKTDSKKKVIKEKPAQKGFGKFAGLFGSKDEKRTVVTFKIRVGNELGLVSSERRPGESQQDHLKRVDAMIDDTIDCMKNKEQNKNKKLRVSLEPMLLK